MTEWSTILLSFTNFFTKKSPSLNFIFQTAEISYKTALPISKPNPFSINKQSPYPCGGNKIKLKKQNWIQYDERKAKLRPFWKFGFFFQRTVWNLFDHHLNLIETTQIIGTSWKSGRNAGHTYFRSFHQKVMTSKNPC